MIVWIFERLHSLKTTFVTIVEWVLAILLIGFVSVERYSLRTIGVCLEEFVDVIFHEAFRGKELKLRNCGLDCEVLAQLDFTWLSPIVLHFLWFEALEIFVIAGFILIVSGVLSFVVEDKEQSIFCCSWSSSLSCMVH